MSQHFRKLSPLEEALALTTTVESPNIICGALDLRGRLDVDAMAQATAKLGERFPHLKMSLVEVKEHGRYSLVRDATTDLEIPFVCSDTNCRIDGDSSLDVVINHLGKVLNRQWDLFGESLFHVHLLRLSDQRHLVACVMNHVVADAITMGDIVREFISEYHYVTTGEMKEFTGESPPSSITGKRSAQNKKTTPLDYWLTLKQAIIPHRKCCLPNGSGNETGGGEHYVKRLLSERDSESALKRSTKFRLPFVDYIMAGMFIAIDRWNQGQGVGTSTLSSALTVNMTGRFQDRNSPNNDSILYFQFDREQRTDLESLARLVYRSRMRLYRDQMDVKYAKGLAKVNRLLGIIPFEWRKKALLSILKSHQTSFALGFTGVMWPNSRRLSADSYLTRAGEFEICEAHGMAYRIVSRTPLYLAAYFFRKRLNLILSAAAWKFTRRDTEEFMDLLVSILDDSH